ncbi:hypothetical protein [Algibacter pectinivorans]|uniref:Lactonase, 7-bladed beta-propeller n=1 Tax=Algibacter pectinivorans TaxID=870482 RepID=A0A1I1M6S6_9FLAO|nr:hypothetical protein [Algibacter pectinivorans]SFC81099.1 hypothetical protein SAMN04487987_10168 [Algibacter pectinivorans]
MKPLKSKPFLATIALTSILAFSCSNDDDDNNMDMGSSSSTMIYASNNSDGNVTIYDVTDSANITTKTLITSSTAADGIYFDSDTDAVIQASRSGLGLEGFTNISMLLNNATVNADLNGSTDMSSPRELAVNGNTYVVADNADVDGDANTPDGKLFIYTRSGNSFTLRNTITTDFKLWGITFKGNDLYAVVDATNELAVYTSFLANTSDATVSATKRIAIEGIVRTHGLTYDSASDVMVMTDIAAATNGQDDGAFHIIENFTSKFNDTANGATLAASQQTRVSGSATLLGNPVDVAYDADTQTVFIAEAGNGGGRILAFNNIGSGGNIAPVVNNSLAAASSVFISKN